MRPGSEKQALPSVEELQKEKAKGRAGLQMRKAIFLKHLRDMKQRIAELVPKLQDMEENETNVTADMADEDDDVDESKGTQPESAQESTSKPEV